ncbi:small ribosomal subunit Rsm22 family protein [Kribbella sp. NBC_00382]|uniref:small ribosomal subunit Rsm22 family protein n=1 Tax=Kribbella sp. NBC_00382 TaxID=2975967 RepID=UPI002E1BB87A
MADLPRDLRDALDAAASGASGTALSSSFQRLSTRYREEVAATAPILKSPMDVVTYSAYRMPATFGAVRAALEQAATSRPGFEPASQLDLGGGTGAAIWAASTVWPSLKSVTVVEQVPEAIALGKQLAKGAESPAVRDATWQAGRIDDLGTLAAADVVTVSYVLSELSTAQQEALVQQLAAQRGLVVVVEPGTPTGYERIVTARDQLIAAGHTIVAPCPHSLDCPIPRGRDWCHFASRVNRSAAHRQTKGAELSFEDEKFSYVISTPAVPEPAENRVLRHPQQRKGLVSLRLCTNGGTLEDTIVSKRQGPLYRSARDTEWGDPWPPISP